MQKIDKKSVVLVAVLAVLAGWPLSNLMAKAVQGNQILDLQLSQEAAPSRLEAPIGPTWTIDSLDAIGCNSGEITWTVTFAGASGYATETLAWANGVLYMNEEFILSNGDVTRNWSLFDIETGGPIEGTWPLPRNTPIMVDFNIRDGIDGPIVYSTDTVVKSCNVPPVPATSTWGLMFGILALGLIGGLAWRRLAT
jgi:hypothetical protein